MEPTKATIRLRSRYAYKISEIRHPNAVILEVGAGIFMTFYTDDIEHIHITDLAYITLELEHAESSQPPIE